MQDENAKTPQPDEEQKPGRQVMLNGHMAQLYANWMETHGKEKPPIYVDENGQAIWVNRAQRRRMEAEKRKAAK